jgi:hypothetical protein
MRAISALAVLCFLGGCNESAPEVEPAVDEVLLVRRSGIEQFTGTAVASASSPDNPPGHAIDGSTSTFWLSWARDGEWWQLDLGSVRELSRLEIVNGGSRAATYRIGFSEDGTTFSNLADMASVQGTHVVTFTPRRARYVRVTGLTRMQPTWSWSIIELRAYGEVPPPPPANLVRKTGGMASASSSASGYPPAYAIDGATTTWWLSAARDGEWWQLDLGRVRTLSRVEFQGGGSRAPTYRLSFSQDGTTFTSLPDGSAAQGLNTVDFPVRSARYVRMTGLTRMDPTWSWGLIELDVYGPDEDPPPALEDKTPGAVATAYANAGPGLTPELAVDGSTSTRYVSTGVDGGWWQLDLGRVRTVSRLEMTNDNAAPPTFRVGLSQDGVAFTYLPDQTNLPEVAKVVEFAATQARYVRIVGLSRAQPTWGWSLVEVKVKGPRDNDTQAPSVPTGFTVNAVPGSAVLTWTASPESDVAGYRVYRDGALIAQRQTVGYTDTQVTAGTTYSYAVSAYDTSTNESARTASLSVTIPTGPLPPPLIPFAVPSPYTRPLPVSGVPLHPFSQQEEFRNELAFFLTKGVRVEQSQFTAALYVVNRNGDVFDTAGHLKASRVPFIRPSGPIAALNAGIEGRGWPVASWMLPSPGERHMAIFDRDTGAYGEFIDANVGNGSMSYGWGGYSPDIRATPGTSKYPNTLWDGATAHGLNLMSFTITEHEIRKAVERYQAGDYENAYIPHLIGYEAYRHHPNEWYYPASRTDWTGTGPLPSCPGYNKVSEWGVGGCPNEGGHGLGILRMGGIFRLDPAVNVQTQVRGDGTAFGDMMARIIARTYQKHGATMTDFSGCGFCLLAEHVRKTDGTYDTGSFNYGSGAPWTYGASWLVPMMQQSLNNDWLQFVYTGRNLETDLGQPAPAGSYRPQ